jgi:CRP-like cAMP-binding protein
MSGLSLIVGSNLVPLPNTELRRRQFKRREVIRAEPYHFWNITQGYVRGTTVDEEGTQITLGLWQAGDVIGQYFSQIDPYQLECLTDVQMTLLPMSYRPDQNLLLDHLHQTQELLKISQGKRLEPRMAQFLDWLVVRFGVPAENGYLIEIRLTHQDIAEVIGTTRVSVTRLLNQFQVSGKISWSPKRLLILR